MARQPFAARRRELRSSRTLHLFLGASALLFLLASWFGAQFDAGRGLARTPLSQTQTHPVATSTDETMTQLDPQTGGHHGAQLPILPQPPPPSSSRLPASSMPLRVISYNIRYATSNPVLGERPWPVRRSKLCTQLRFITAGHESPFVCLQECLYSQVIDIQSCLGPSWSYIGRGRGEFETDGEFSPVFYRSDAWDHVRSETRWLSETPDVPSRGWDAALNRIVTMGQFRHKVSGTSVVVMSTHFDHRGVRAREHSAGLLLQFADEWGRGRDSSQPSVVLVGGDFNSTPDDGAYKAMTAPGSGMSDISDLVPVDEHYGNHLTYTSFGEPREWPKRIDFLFIQEPRTAVVTTFGVLANSFDDQIRSSDHRPVVADMNIVP